MKFLTLNKNQQRGFTLIMTISLMVLLTMIGIGLLSLSAVSMRSSSQSEARSLAKSHARLALMLAIGNLQKYAGADTRITAPSDIIEHQLTPSAPKGAPLTGVWRSWEGSDHTRTGTAAGRPIPPIYNSKMVAQANGTGRFLTWLISGQDTTTEPTSPSSFASKIAVSGSVPLMATGTLAAGDDRQVHVIPQTINDKGAMAWWVSGENQKARLPEPYRPTDISSAAQWSDINKSHSVPNPTTLGLDDSQPEYLNSVQKTASRSTVGLYTQNNAALKPHQLFYDFSVSSVGLLTNTATGGWRKDLSLFTENWSTSTIVPDSNLPLFRYDTFGTSSGSQKPTPIAPITAGAQQLLYPWSDHGTGASNDSHGAVSSWMNLVTYATEYKRIVYTGNGIPSLSYTHANAVPTTTSTNSDLFANFHNLGRPSGATNGGRQTIPIIARIHWVLSHRAVRVGTPGDYKYEVQMLISPIITLWNPYNYEITNLPNGRFDFTLGRAIPFAFRYYGRSGQPNGPLMLLFQGQNSNGLTYSSASKAQNTEVTYSINNPFTLAPGEARVFSPSTVVVLQSNPPALALSPGVRLNQGHRIDIGSPGNGIGWGFWTLDADSEVKMDFAFDADWRESAGGGGTSGLVGIWLDFFSVNNSSKQLLAGRMQYSQSAANNYWKPINANDESGHITAAELATPGNPANPSATEGWRPFFAVVFGSRVASGPQMPAKGFLQASPTMNTYRTYANVAGQDAYVGLNHPVNSACDYRFISFPSGNSDQLPNVTTDGKGFIVTGFTAADGLSRAVVAGVPLRPIASLGELQNWDLRGQNQFPPYQYNVIGNSDATPLMPPNAVLAKSGSLTDAQWLQHDDAYCANHLLFDDWFVSSIAPSPGTFGNSAVSKTINQTYQQLLLGQSPLVNRSYKPIWEDRVDSTQSNAASLAATRTTANLTSVNSWQKIASRLEVAGMFNVNSTSLKAWRALLGHARNQRVPYTTTGSITNLSNPVNHAFSRFPVAGDLAAGQQGMSGAFDRSSSFTGFQVFTDQMIDKLAEKVVEQVRLRGPFLSLSEFVNRQLSSNNNLALAGAVQTALNAMITEVGMNGAYGDLSNPEYSADTLSVNDPRMVGSGYLYPAASVGKSSYGLPGWIRQADILTPIAPILSARDDTFTIRAYGDARDSGGKILAKAWCEATVQRSRDYVDLTDKADLSAQTIPAANQPASLTNQVFGRRYKIIAFRWLTAEEI